MSFSFQTKVGSPAFHIYKNTTSENVDKVQKISAQLVTDEVGTSVT